MHRAELAVLLDGRRLWDAFAVTPPDKIKGRSQPERFADLVPFVRFALEHPPVLEPFSDSVAARFDSWLGVVRDPLATSLSIEAEDFDLTQFSQRGGRRETQPLFVEPRPKLLDGRNEVLAA